MALSGALQADFSDFVNEANKASAALGVMDAEAKKTGTTLAKTGAAVDGFGGAASGSAAGFDKFTSGLRSVDASMNALGVNISKPIAMIEELSKVAETGIRSLGALGTAGLALGAGMAAWDFGKWSMTVVPEISNAWDKFYEILGLNAIQAETLAAKQDVLRRATEVAKRPITDQQEAMWILWESMKAGTQVMDVAIHRQALWEKEIRAHRAELPLMIAALENHTATVADLSREYGISEKALTFYVAKTKDQTAAQDEATRKAEAAAAAQQKLKDAMFGGDSITKANEMAAALGGVSNVSRMTTDEQAKLNTAVGEAIETYTRWGETAPASLNAIYNATVSIGKVTTGLGSEWANVGTKFTPTADTIIAQTQQMAADTAAYEAETQAMAQAWQTVPAPIDQTTAAVGRMTVAMQNFGTTATTAYESAIAGAQLFKAYQDAGIATSGQIAMGGYNFKQLQQTGVPGGLASTMWANAAPGNTLNVNVNSTDAQDIAGKLVTEMSRQGVRF